MKIDPGFANHWKTDLLIDQIGPAGVVALLRLWGWVQINREWSGLDLSPEKLAKICRWRGDALSLWDSFREGPWIIEDRDERWSIYGWEEHQSQIIGLWKNGKKGGRPRNPEEPNTNQKVSNQEPKGSRMETIRGKSRSKSKSKSTTTPVLPHGPRFAEAWSAWQQHRTEIRKPLTPTSIKQQLKKLGAMRERDAVTMIEHTVANGWQGLREPDPPRGKRNEPPGSGNPPTYRPKAPRQVEDPVDQAEVSKLLKQALDPKNR